MVKTIIAFLLVLVMPALVFCARFDAYTDETVLNDADQFLIWDDSESAVNNATVGVLFSHFNLGTAALLDTGVAIGDVPILVDSGGNASLVISSIDLPTMGDYYVNGTSLDADVSGGIDISFLPQKAREIVTKSTSAILTPAEVSGTLIITSTAITLTLPTAVAGYYACFLAGQSDTIIIGVQPSGGDFLVVDGTRGTVATTYASGGALGDKICFTATNTLDWYVSEKIGTWSE